MALPSVPYRGRLDEKRMDRAGYYEPYRCTETPTYAVFEDKERAAYISLGTFAKAQDFAELEGGSLRHRPAFTQT